MKKTVFAYAKAIIAMLIWGSLALFVKNIDYPSAEIVLARILFAMAFLLILFALKRRRPDGAALKKHGLKLLISGAAMGMNWAALFESYRWVDVSIATLCYYTAPVFVMIGSILIFREKLSLPRAAGMIAAVAGMFIVTGAVMGGADPVKGVLFALLSAVLYASVSLSVKSVSGLSGLEITIGQLAGALCVMLPYALITHRGAWRFPETGELLCMAALGVLHTGIALYAYFSAIQDLSVQSVALLSYIDPLSALGFAAMFLGERMGFMQWIGAALILGGALFGELIKTKKN